MLMYQLLLQQQQTIIFIIDKYFFLDSYLESYTQ